MTNETVKNINSGDWIIYDHPQYGPLEGRVVENSSATILGTPVLSVEVDVTVSARNHKGQYGKISRDHSIITVKPKQITSVVSGN